MIYVKKYCIIYLKKGRIMCVTAVKYLFVCDEPHWEEAGRPPDQLWETPPHYQAPLQGEACRCHPQKSKNVNATKKTKQQHLKAKLNSKTSISSSCEKHHQCWHLSRPLWNLFFFNHLSEVCIWNFDKVEETRGHFYKSWQTLAEVEETLALQHILQPFLFGNHRFTCNTGFRLCQQWFHCAAVSFFPVRRMFHFWSTAMAYGQKHSWPFWSD